MAKKKPEDRTLAETEQLFTARQKKYFSFIAIGLDPREAAKRAGYKQIGASSAANNQKYVQAFREAFAMAGFSIADIVEKVKAGSNAMRESFDERTGEWKETADWNARHKFIDTAIDLQGFYAPKNVEVSGQNGGPIKVEFT
jgi:hypothetical protein